MHNRMDNVSYTNDSLVVNNKKVKIFSQKTPSDIPWGSVGVDVVCESTGVYLTKETSEGHLKGGAKKVILSAPSKDDTPMFV